MLQKIFSHPMFKSYMKLPLWSKIAVPVGILLVVGWIVAPLLKFALLIAALGVAGYFFLSLTNRS